MTAGKDGLSVDRRVIEFVRRILSAFGRQLAFLALDEPRRSITATILKAAGGVEQTA